MKRAAAIIVLLTLCLNAGAQDQIFKTDNAKLQVKVLEVGPTEIRYKMFDNPDGPTYVEAKSNVAMIIYQNGQHQIISPAATASSTTTKKETKKPTHYAPPEMALEDSLIYFRYVNSLSVNFLNFFNNELGVLYRREFFKSQFNIIIPIAFGVAKPNVTQSTYFNRGNGRLELGNKVIEGGFGIHYYPSLRSNSNYYIGPMIRYMQYTCTQYENVSYPFMPVNSKSTTLDRWAFSITNGLIYRTKSRITTSIFASVGFKRDIIADPLVDLAGVPIKSIQNEFSFYWWSGFEVGFNF